MFDKYELKEILSNTVSTVVFTKIDGTERELKCTLLPEYLPAKSVVEGQQLLTESLPRKENPDILAVWDMERNGWRSFRTDSVKAVVTHETRIS
jgi:hypothetical protein